MGEADKIVILCNVIHYSILHDFLFVEILLYVFLHLFFGKSCNFNVPIKANSTCHFIRFIGPWSYHDNGISQEFSFDQLGTQGCYWHFLMSAIRVTVIPITLDEISLRILIITVNEDQNFFWMIKNVLKYRVFDIWVFIQDWRSV